MGPKSDDGARVLRLRAEDAEDLRVISAALQDAIVPVADMAFIAAERRFVMVANRFRWEDLGDAGEPGSDAGADPGDGDASFLGDRSEDDPSVVYERTNCGIHFDGVLGVQTRSLDRNQRDRLLDLLAIEPLEDAIQLTFAGGAAVRLKVDRIDCLVRDLGQSWPTTRRPRHAEVDASEPEAGQEG